MVGKARKAWHQLQHKGNGTAVRPKGRLRIAKLDPCPHAYAPHLFLITLVTPKTHLNPVGLSPSHVLQLRIPSAQNGMSPRVRQCTKCTAPKSAANISSYRANRK